MPGMSTQELQPEVLLSDQEQGRILRAWRLAKRLKPDDLARRIGRQPATLGEWERGRRHLTEQNRALIARILAITPEMLLHAPDIYVKGGGMETPETEEKPSAKDADHDGLFRALARAARSGPAEYPTRMTPDQEPYWPIEGAEEIVRFTTRLFMEAALQAPVPVESAAGVSARPRTPPMTERNTIIMTWRGRSDPLDEVADTYLRSQWISALRVALARGWFIKHCIQITDEDATRKAFTSVLNVIAFTGRTIRYRPHLLMPPPGSPQDLEIDDFIVVPSKGILVLYNPRVAHYYKAGSQGYEKWYAAVKKLTQGSEELHTPYMRLSPARIKAIAEVEAARGDRYLFMDGLPLNLIPERTLDELYNETMRNIKESALPPERKLDYEELAKTTWRYRKDREAKLRDSLDEGRYWSRDIILVESIRRFVETGQSCFRNIGDTFALLAQVTGGKLEYTPRQVLACLNALIERIQRYPKYELILVDRLDQYDKYEFMREKGLADTQGIYCMLKEKQAIILQFWRANTPMEGEAPENPVNATPEDYLTIRIKDERIVRAFMSSSNLRPFKSGQTPAQRRDVLLFLQEQVRLLQDKIDQQPDDDA